MSVEVWLLLGVPLVFAVGFLAGYRDGVHAKRVWAYACAALVVTTGASGLIAPSARGLWAAGNLVLTILCALGIVDNVRNRNPYSGFGALVFYPLALIAALSLLGVGLAAALA